jgi:hypothetical protein
LNIASSLTLKAFATATGLNNSAVASGNYVIQPPGTRTTALGAGSIGAGSIGR